MFVHPLFLSTIRSTHVRVALLTLFALPVAACDGVDDGEPAAEPDQSLLAQDEPELAANVPPAAGDDEAAGPGGPADLQAVPVEPSALKHDMCCQLDYSTPFQIKVRIPNVGTGCADFAAEENTINYRVYHYYGDPPPFQSTTPPIDLGTTRVISLSHTDYLNASSCVAWFNAL